MGIVEALLYFSRSKIENASLSYCVISIERSENNEVTIVDYLEVFYVGRSWKMIRKISVIVRGMFNLPDIKTRFYFQKSYTSVKCSKCI